MASTTRPRGSVTAFPMCSRWPRRCTGGCRAVPPSRSRRRTRGRSAELRPALHGLLYGLPTVCFAAADRLLLGHGVLTMLVVALLTSWALSQALAYLGYMRLGQGLPVQAKRVLLAGLGAGLEAWSSPWASWPWR